MMSLEEIREALGGVRLEVVAAETGLSYGTVRMIRSGIASNPTLRTLQLLSDWITKNASVGQAAR